MRTDSVLGRTLLDLHSDAEEGMDLARSSDSEVAAAAEVLAETISEKDPTSPRYQAPLRCDVRKDCRSVYRGDRIYVQHSRTYIRKTVPR
jgi:hypothetical protein